MVRYACTFDGNRQALNLNLVALFLLTNSLALPGFISSPACEFGVRFLQESGKSLGAEMIVVFD